jgi:hypothetical protein
MNPKIHTPSPLESSEDLHLPKSEPKPNAEPQEKMGRKAGDRRNWLDGSMIGQKFGKTTVIGVGNRNNSKGITLVPCLCDCGKTFLRSTSRFTRTNACRECGTLAASHKKTVHGKIPRDVYMAWHSMKDRCLNPNHPFWYRYGGRGITVSEQWKDFEAFRNDVGPKPSKKHSLDRIDNDLGYFPDNCRWATRKQQNLNRSNSKYLTAFGESKLLVEWAKVRGIPHTTLRNRIALGWGAERALTQPVVKRK